MELRERHEKRIKKMRKERAERKEMRNFAFGFITFIAMSYGLIYLASAIAMIN